MHLDLHIPEARSLQQRCERAWRVQVSHVLPVGRCPPVPCALSAHSLMRAVAHVACRLACTCLGTMLAAGAGSLHHVQ